MLVKKDNSRRSKSVMMIWLLSGPLSALIFLTSLVGFARVRTDGYTHGTKAISELGAIGASNALAFNLLGFIFPGVLIIIFATGLIKLRRLNVKIVGPLLLIVSGLSFVVAGLFPVNLEERGSLTSILHALGAGFSGVFWALSLFWLGNYFKAVFGLHKWAKVTPWFVLFLITNIIWQGIWQTNGSVLPGWGQRIAFAGYFIWLAITGYLVILSLALRNRSLNEANEP